MWHVPPGDGLGLAGPNRTCKAQAHSFPFLSFSYYTHVLTPRFLFIASRLSEQGDSAGEVDGLHVSARQQLRPVSGFLLSDASVCKAYEICNGAPSKEAINQCKGGIKHSFRIVGHGDKFSDGSDVEEHLSRLEDSCFGLVSDGLPDEVRSTYFYLFLLPGFFRPCFRHEWSEHRCVRITFSQHLN